MCIVQIHFLRLWYRFLQYRVQITYFFTRQIVNDHIFKIFLLLFWWCLVTCPWETSDNPGENLRDSICAHMLLQLIFLYLDTLYPDHGKAGCSTWNGILSRHAQQRGPQPMQVHGARPESQPNPGDHIFYTSYGPVWERDGYPTE